MPTADAAVPFSEQRFPATDVYLANGGLVIQVELAGIRRQDLKLLAEGNRLTISGERPDNGRNPTCAFVVMEIRYGPFERVLEIPGGYDLAHAHAVCANGFLRVEVPALG